jgi:hypothetical protein
VQKKPAGRKHLSSAADMGREEDAYRGQKRQTEDSGEQSEHETDPAEEFDGSDEESPESGPESDADRGHDPAYADPGIRSAHQERKTLDHQKESGSDPKDE